MAGGGAAGGDGHVHGDAPRGQGVDKGRGVEEAAAEDGYLFARYALALRKLDDAVGDPLSLFPWAGRHLVKHGAQIAYGGHFLGVPRGAALVANDRLLRERDDVRGGAVVGPEMYLAGAGEGLPEVADVLDPRAAEAVDALRVVPDAEDVRFFAGHEPAQEPHLAAVRVLELVDQNVVVEAGDLRRRAATRPQSLRAYCTTPS